MTQKWVRQCSNAHLKFLALPRHLTNQQVFKFVQGLTQSSPPLNLSLLSKARSTKVIYQLNSWLISDQVIFFGFSSPILFDFHEVTTIK